jgi:exopolyphosphatase/guanosine-5'-triphosphate,3'-diphosphate pyrophosphatase
LLVATPTDHGFRVIDAFSRIVRLGEGLTRTGRLSDAAIDRTVSALRVCAGKMRNRNVTRSRIVATEACRRAENGAAFVDRVREEVGFDLDIITPAEEAELALAGCLPLVDRECTRALVFDIGGGSTELMWLSVDGANEPEVVGWTSLPCGVVTLSEQFGDCGGDGDAFNRMVGAIADMLSPFAADHPLNDGSRQAAHMLGTSGTVTTLAAVHLGLDRYDRSKVDGVWMTLDDLGSVTRQISAMSYEERTRHACIRRGRADLVIAGCAVLEGISRHWPIGRLRVADRGLREGMLLAMMREADAETVQ